MAFAGEPSKDSGQITRYNQLLTSTAVELIHVFISRLKSAKAGLYEAKRELILRHHHGDLTLVLGKINEGLEAVTINLSIRYSANFVTKTNSQ